jgi:lipoprotein-anchoring transpeptidase ErfK/SrfK
MWTYEITTGIMSNGTMRFQGYSGAGHSPGEGRDNPAMQAMVGQGPIPVGNYMIGAPRDSARLGPYVMDLDPETGTNTFGRSLFRIHGNNATNDSSHGCVILPPDARHAIGQSGDTWLRVVV